MMPFRFFAMPPADIAGCDTALLLLLAADDAMLLALLILLMLLPS